MKKSIFLFFAAILCSVSAWAYDLAAGQYVYFEKPADWSNVSLLLGHNSWSQGYNMTKISNTNLYYWKTDSWGGYTRYCFIDAKGWGGEGKKPDDRKTYASHSTNVFTNQLIKYHLFTTAGSKSSHASSYATAVNRTQTIKVQLKDGSNWVDATLVPADLKASTYALTSATAAGAKSASLAKESTTVSATVDAAYSATVSLTCENVLDGYVFDGWYDANGNKITSYTVSDAHTVFARFIQSAEETNEVTVTYMCGTTSVATAIAEIVGVETEKSFTAPTVTGYKFTEWTIGTGITLKAGTASDATISVVTKSASSDYTLIANYEEVIETIYFINTGKWSVVNLHRWGGTAAETAWPGEAMTSTGEKIGEYDVYSFTAQQGAFKNVIFTNKNTGSDQTGDLEWTAGKYYINNYNGNSGWYTKAEAEELLVVPAVYETVYFVNNKNWTKVQIHAWKGSVNNGWPGQALTATGEKVEGFDVYSFEAAQGTYTNLIFNNKVGDAGDQSSNFVWTADKYYYMGAAENYAGGTKEEVAALVAPDPLATDVFLAGEMNSWNATANEFKKATAEATTASVTISLTAKTYMFKIIAGDWLGNKGTMKRDNCTGWTFEKLDGGDETNCKIVADIAGDYTFTWDLTSKKLTVTYPELPTYNVTATVNPAETGSVEGAKEYKQGEQATLIATPAAGYEFVNWTVAGEEVSAKNPYEFTVTENVDLIANFAKKVYIVTVAAENGKVEGLAADGKYEHGAEATLTATAAEGYEFTCWTSGEDTVSTENPYKFTVTADVALVANFELIPPTKYNVTVTAENGTVEGAGEYEEGKTATLTATPAEGYQFVNWTKGEEVVSTENPYTFTVTADIALVANFQATEPVVEVPAASVRAWAYDLALAVEGEQYTFSYKATTAALATLIFTDVDGEELATKDLGLVEAGANTVVLAADELPAGQKVNWAVKLEAGAIANIVEVTDQSRGIYDFYNMMDVLVDNNPESEYFGKIYIQMSLDGKTDGSTERADTQKAGLFIYDQELNELNNPSNVGIKPILPEGYTMGDNRNQFHRLDINPNTGDLTYCYNVKGQPAVFAIDRANLTGEVTNLLSGVEGLTQTAAHCFDAEGALYVMDLPAAGTIYKIVNGVATVFAATDSKWVNASMTLAADGKGGLWVAQNRGQLDSYYQLAHVTSAGVIDWSVYDNLGTFVQNQTPGTSSTGWTGGAARGALAYDAERQLLAQGRNGKVEVYSVAYDAETGVPTLTLVASTPTVGTNIDGLHFDYAGDLYVVNSSKEKFQKFAMPTNNNVCTTPAASKYAFQNIEYDTMEITMTNLEVAEMGGYLVLTASDEMETGLNVMLALNEDGSVSEMSYASIISGWMETELPIVEGTITKTYSEELATDVYSGLVVVEYNEGYLGLDLTMYYVAPEYTDIVITNATVTEDIRDLGWGDETYTVLLLESTWSDGVETYPVLVEVNDYDLSVVEGTAVVSVTIGGQGDEDPWLGNVPDGEMKYTIADGVITLQGKLENASAWPAPVYWNLTISGKLPQGPTTALDNIAVEAKAIKMIKNGQLIIIKNGVQYNVQGQVIK